MLTKIRICFESNLKLLRLGDKQCYICTPMLLTLGLMIVGIIVGRFLRTKKNAWVAPAVMATVCILLFIMGLRVGLNKEITSSIRSTGVMSVILFACGTGGAVVLTWLFTKYVIDQRSKTNHSNVAKDTAEAKQQAGGAKGK